MLSPEMLSYIPQFIDPFSSFDTPFAYKRGGHRHHSVDRCRHPSPRVEQFDIKEGCQIHITKPSDNFDSYNIRLTKNSDGHHLKIASQEDEFDRTFFIDEKLAEIHNITWKVYHKQNTLVINVPRHQNEDHLSADPKEVKRQRKLERKLKRIRKEQKKLRAAKKLARRQKQEELDNHSDSDANLPNGVPSVSKIEVSISVPATPETSEAELTPHTDSDSDSQSNTGSRSFFKPTLEEVEDEEFVMYRKMLSPS